VLNASRRVVDMARSTEPITVEIEYSLSAAINGLRVGVYLQTTRGEQVFTSFDTDSAELYDQFATRPVGHYISRFTLPPDYLNEGRYVVGVNASTFRVKRYFSDEQALIFTVDPAGAPGMQWHEPRGGVMRPRLEWQIEAL
jgi:lipopolysaccharide transport system ATP-binding protein